MLMNFFGQECPHCEKMESVIAKLEHETGVTVERLEVWHNDENMKKLNELDKNFCGGVPFFYNTDTNKWICGEATIDELKTWAGK
jgi:hypothetical protein